MTMAPTAQAHALKVRNDCAQLFVLYTGMAGRMMIPAMQFIEETKIVDRNLIIVRDLQHCCYQRGVSPNVPSVQSFLSWQQSLLQKKELSHVREVYCVGSSGGAYAAMLSGHFLKAAKVWAFAPPVPVLTGERVSYVDPEFADLSKVLTSDNETTKYRVYYNESMEFDRTAAQRLQGLPGVELLPQAGQGHGVIVHLAQQAQLGTLLPSFVGCK